MAIRTQDQTAPDGGYGWIIVVVVMLNFFNAGLIFAAFGVLYLEFVNAFQMSVASVGLVMSISCIVTHFGGIIIPGLFSGTDPRILSSLSAVSTSLCFLASAFSTTFTGLIVAFAFTGFGQGVLYVINSAILQTYFNKKRTLVTGLTTVGMSISNVVIPSLTRFLIDFYTWRGAIVILSGFLMQSVWLSMLLRPLHSPNHHEVITKHSEPEHSRRTISLNTSLCKTTKNTNSTLLNMCVLFGRKLNLRIFLNPKFITFGFGTLLFFTGYNMYYLHIINKGLDSGLSAYQATAIPAVSGLVNLIWRPTFGLISTLCTFNRILTVGVSTILFGVFIAIFGAMTHFVLFAIVSGLSGIALASQVISYHPALVDILGIENVLAGVSLLGLFVGLGQMIGTPLAGWIYDVTQNYNIPFYVAGCIEVVAGVIYLSLMWSKTDSNGEPSTDHVTYDAVSRKERLRLDSVASSVIGSTLSIGGI